MPHVYPAFDAYLRSDDARTAPQWHKDSLSQMQFHGEVEPTVELYTMLRAVLSGGGVAAAPVLKPPVATVAEARDVSVTTA